MLELTREQVIRAIVDHELDNIDDYTSFEEACAKMIQYGTKGLNNLSNEELENEYMDTLSPEDDVKIVEEVI